MFSFVYRFSKCIRLSIQIEYHVFSIPFPFFCFNRKFYDKFYDINYL